MAEVQTNQHLKVQTSCIVDASWVVDDGSNSPEPLAIRPRRYLRKVKDASGKVEERTFLKVGPGAILDLAKIPKKRQVKMLEKRYPAAIPIDAPIPPSPKKTAVHQAAADAGDEIARIDTSKRETATPPKRTRTRK